VDDVIVRVEDARLVPDGGPAWFVVTGLPDPRAVADRAASAGGAVRVDARGRLRALVTPRQLVNAAGRVDAALGRAVDARVDAVVDAWRYPPTTVRLGGGAKLDAASRPLVMGIVNVTPDSFSDGGTAYDPDAHPDRAVAHADELLAAGADLLDVGGESTRPGADPVDADEELGRVVPVVEALADRAVVSVDTTKAVVARAAVEAGAVLVNDVSAGSLDDQLLPTVAELGVAYVLMHMQGTPRTMQRDPTYGDVVAEVYESLWQGCGRLEAVGVDPDQVLVDPGIGFGKTVAHNHALLAGVRQFAELGHPVLVGTSRKSFLAADADLPEPTDRVAGSVATATAAVLGGAAMVRVHDVAETRQAVDVVHRIVGARAAS
jgi:dihydropteroate synthase